MYICENDPNHNPAVNLFLISTTCCDASSDDDAASGAVNAGGLRAVAQIEDGAVGLGMTTFVSPINSITPYQKVMLSTDSSKRSRIDNHYDGYFTAADASGNLSPVTRSIAC